MGGKVYLVGAGPGDPQLITVKALETLKKADVIVYDRLVSRALKKFFPKNAERIYAGKSTGRHTITQEQIHNTIVNKAREGKVVVRLKGGDPFLFGRGGEEAEELRKAGIKFEVIPGVTSAIAVPAYAGIPITHRKYASSIAIVTGHEDPNKKKDIVDWKKLAIAVDTIIVLMGVKRLKNIVQELEEGGLHQNTPIALIKWGTTHKQRVVTGTLKNIVDKAIKENVKPPAIIIIGEVVKLQKKLFWFGN